MGTFILIIVVLTTLSLISENRKKTIRINEINRILEELRFDSNNDLLYNSFLEKWNYPYFKYKDSVENGWDEKIIQLCKTNNGSPDPWKILNAILKNAEDIEKLKESSNKVLTICKEYLPIEYKNALVRNEIIAITKKLLTNFFDTTLIEMLKNIYQLSLTELENSPPGKEIELKINALEIGRMGADSK